MQYFQFLLQLFLGFITAKGSLHLKKKGRENSLIFIVDYFWTPPLLMHLHFKPMTMTNYDWVSKPVFSKTMNHKKLNIISLILICRINKVAKYLTKSAACNNECLLISWRRCDTMRGGGIQRQPGRGRQSDSWLTQSPAGCITVKTWKPTRCCY